MHGFFTVGNPDETIEDMNATFDFASRLPLDTFGFNRLCVYQGTPLRQEYVETRLVNETTDWYNILNVQRSIRPVSQERRSTAFDRPELETFWL